MKIQALRGMQDLLPARRSAYRAVEDVLRPLLASHGYSEVGLPVMETTGLFERLGESTDVVQKEMYTFEDRSGDSVTLRPEGTAGCVRAAEENGLLFNQVQRLWYSGPMFRYERPQKGRFRQFEQIGVECFGMPGPDIDAEILLLSARFWEELEIDRDLDLELNSLGSLESRVAYREALLEFLRPHRDALDEDSRLRLDTNPLRILDTKDRNTQELLDGAPHPTDFLDDESREHFDGLRRILDRAQIAYRLNPRIVRGLDYYNRTVFEWTTTTLGAQGTVCGGGRYDGLVAELGGRPTPAVGFAIGVDRLALMLEASGRHASLRDHVYVASMGESARIESLLLTDQIRRRLPGLRVTTHCGGGKFSSQMKKADKSGARLALIIGEDEVGAGEVTVKELRTDAQQMRLTTGEVLTYIERMFSGD